MSEVKVGKNESLDSALKRFKRSCQKSGVLQDIRNTNTTKSPVVRKKKKSEAARKKKKF
jgi:small subunit ribosomal protein S21